jgi:tRNA(fMet)-specific endonuclease VapC
VFRDRIQFNLTLLTSRDSKQDHLDKLIAAHALSLNVILVTNNLKDFARFPAVVAENWIH